MAFPVVGAEGLAVGGSAGDPAGAGVGRGGGTGFAAPEMPEFSVRSMLKAGNSPKA
ncbi:hypothetical protein [Sphaerisporangium album]|nr:hypothetical protein [Sphaerisporangium album]